MSTAHLPTILDRLAAQGAPASQLQRLRTLRTLCERTPHCVGLALVGSYAQGKGDRISDLDLVALFKEGQAQSFLQAAHQELSSPELLSAYSGRYGAEGGFWKYVFLDFTSCELYALNLPTTLGLRIPYLAIWDPIEVLASLEVEGEPPRHEDFDVYPHGDEGLLWELFDCVKWMKRGRTALTHQHLRRLAAKLPPEGAT